MEYPDELMPKVGMPHVTDDLSKYSLIRKSNSVVEFDESTHRIKDGCIHEVHDKQYLEWSCNLYANYSIDNLDIEILERKFNSYWDYATAIEPPTHPNQFDRSSDTNHYFIPISKVEKIKIPYDKASNSYHTQAFVHHCPTLCNYWHFEIRWRDADGNPIPRGKSGAWVKQIRGSIKAMIRQHVKPIADKTIYKLGEEE